MGTRRRRELAGAAEALEVRFEEEFAGRTRSAWDAARRAACRLRCGRRSSFGGGVEVEVVCIASVLGAAAFCPAIEPLFGAEDVKAPLLDAARAFSSKVFPEKYSARNRGVVPLTAAVRVGAVEKFLFTGLEGILVFAVCRRHDRHTVLRPLDRKALVAEYRIIIACCCYLEAVDALLKVEVVKLSLSDHFYGRYRLANQRTRI